MSAAPERGLLLAEFETPETLEHAIVSLRSSGLRMLDAFTPYPVPSIEIALSLKPSRLAYWILAMGLFGAAFAFTLQYWLIAKLYPLDVGGLPGNSWPAFIPITFETMVLAASLTGFFGFLACARLPRLWHAVFTAPGFETASVDRFWLSVDLRDPKFDEDEITRTVTDLGASRVLRTPEPT